MSSERDYSRVICSSALLMTLVCGYVYAVLDDSWWWWGGMVVSVCLLFAEAMVSISRDIDMIGDADDESKNREG